MTNAVQFQMTRGAFSSPIPPRPWIYMPTTSYFAVSESNLRCERRDWGVPASPGTSGGLYLYKQRRTTGHKTHTLYEIDWAMAARASASSPTLRSPPRRSTTSGRSTTSRPVVTGWPSGRFMPLGASSM